jgi:hypothetical protein
METQIEPDGTGDRTRSTQVIATIETVRWIEVMFGSTTPNPKARGVCLEKVECFDEKGRQLEKEFYEDVSSEERVIIFLHDPVRVGGPPQTVRMHARMRSSWIDLIERLEDEALYIVENEVESVSYTIHVPANFRIEDFTVEPGCGSYRVAPDKMSVTWTATQLSAGSRFRFSMRCLRAN